MKKLLHKARTNMSLNLIGTLVILMLVFGLIVCYIGNACFVNAFTDEYASVTYHMADSASMFVNGDHIDDYLAGERREEYEQTKRRLDTCCEKLNVSLLYVIKVDTSDYGRFVSVFNSVNNSVDNSSYTPWELGYQRDTTNDEYREKYRQLYEKDSAYETILRLNTSNGTHPHITTLVPVKDSDNKVTALLCIQRPISEMERAVKPYFLFIMASVFLMVVIVVVIAAVFLRKAVIRPVEIISREAARFAKENTKGEPFVNIGRFEVIRRLADSIESMETDMLSYVDNLTAVTAEREKIGAELSIAATIQSNSLPDVFPAFPDRSEFDIYASMDPAKEVGGDFYNFFLIDEDHLGLVIADVSGKGIPAALFMMVTNILIRNRAIVGGTPAEVLSYVNNDLCDHNKADMFVTVWLGMLEISTGKLIAANAGHEYPVIYRKNGGFELLKDKHAFVIGAMKGMPYHDYEITLNKGDKLFVYTDGLPEATDKDNGMYTVDRMVSKLNELKELSPKEILIGMRDSVSEFVGDAPRFDDLTMLCLEIRDDPEENDGK